MVSGRPRRSTPGFRPAGSTSPWSASPATTVCSPSRRVKSVARTWSWNG